ncbi:portal protein [Caulobacter hibisci]|uniref:Uncharacterized protein n=1 Tax=Caulobacter hibisci TaxID=2035993 RepID=A0ABS0SXW9_9CAUL|nr:portal protein [Caulobacter hibisci]MBI1684454.1 hypothetical protein [Caulobacter hibisci]
MAADWKAIIRQRDHLKAIRALRDSEFQLIADYYMPRKTFEVAPQKGQLRPRLVTTSVPQRALADSAAFLVGYLIDHTRPFVKPNVARGLVAAGRQTELDDASLDYLDGVSWSVFDRMMLPQSGFLQSVSRLAIELRGFGTGVLWTGRKRGFGPVYQARPFRRCWMSSDENDQIDTVYYEWCLPAWQVVQQYPAAKGVDKIAELANDPKREQTDVTLLHAVEPRRTGRALQAGSDKPFASVVIAVDYEGAVLEESGYDSFPYSVPRLGVEEGSAYGTGDAWRALPDAMVLNALQRDVEAGVGLRVRPPMFSPARLFGKPIDRRPGALNVYDETGLGFQTLKDAIQYMPVGGDVGIGSDYMQMLERRIEQAFMTDWMRLPDNGQRTATEINDRRDTRLRAMAALIPGVDRDLMGVCASRTLDVMVAEGQLAPPTEQLSEVEVDWDYAGPLAIAQQMGQVGIFERILGLAERVAQIDSREVATVAMGEGLRASADALGAPVGMMRSRTAVAEIRAEDDRRAEEKHQAETAATAAAALRDGGQGVQTLVAADQMQNQERMAA